MNVNEIFFSIQGEGTAVGTPTIFIRTSGCNLRCSFCDTKYAYIKGKEMNIGEIISKIKKIPCKVVCITGGEPLLQNDIMMLIDTLLVKGYILSIETNGSIPINKLAKKKSVVISLDIKCPSSRMQQQMDLNNISLLSKKDQLKFIIKNKKDYDYAKEIVQHYTPACTVFFQPVWGTNVERLVSWILEDGLHVRLGIQLHKLIWGEKKGV